jgi:mannan endo-1,4-beta-mannosidase
MDEPTIMAWELINEPHCHVDYSGKTVNVTNNNYE